MSGAEANRRAISHKRSDPFDLAACTGMLSQAELYF